MVFSHPPTEPPHERPGRITAAKPSRDGLFREPADPRAQDRPAA